MPVSATLISMCEFTRSSRTCTLPSLGVNLMAFDSRFQITCWSRSGSPKIGPAAGSRKLSRRMSLASAAGRTVSMAASMIDNGSTGCTSRRSLPDGDAAHVEQVFDQLGLHPRVALDGLETLDVVRVVAAPRRRTCAQPRMAFSGVRSSCESVARNSSLTSLMRSAARRAPRARCRAAPAARRPTSAPLRRAGRCRSRRRPAPRRREPVARRVP